jgi:adenylate cyclase
MFSGINYFLESKKSKVLRELFSKKVSPNVMEELVSVGDNTHHLLEPRDKEITIFFSDIRSFTTISETIGNPKKVIELLNFYMTPMVENITKHKGTVDKFIGDAIMAYWNAPVDIKNHADEAVSSAIEQIKILKNMKNKVKEKFNINLDIGIGINSGVATIGEMGSEGRADYTVIGDNVNLASRLEGLNKVYKTHILISEFCFELLTKEYIIREVDLVRVKGKTKPVKIYEVIDFGTKDFSIYYKALNFYRKSNFQEAKEIFEQLFKDTKDIFYEVYIQRCEYFIKNPPKDFDGVWIFNTK